VLQRDRHRFAVPGGPVQAEHRVLADQFTEYGPASITAPCVYRERLIDRIGLRVERLDKAGQQASTVVRDDDRGNGMPGLRCIS
jgi:hypothetical protein